MSTGPAQVSASLAVMPRLERYNEAEVFGRDFRKGVCNPYLEKADSESLLKISKHYKIQGVEEGRTSRYYLAWAINQCYELEHPYLTQHFMSCARDSDMISCRRTNCSSRVLLPAVLDHGNSLDALAALCSYLDVFAVSCSFLKILAA